VGVLAVTDQTATFHSPVGTATLVRTISDELTKLTARKAIAGSMTDKDYVSLLWFLANHGFELWRKVIPNTTRREELARAARLHVFAAAPGDFLPVEFFYPRPAPRKSKLCLHVRHVLHQGASDGPCTSDPPDSEVCPLQFWGFNRLIERYPYMGDNQESGSPRTEPVPPADHLNIFRQAIVGASELVRSADLEDEDGIMPLLTSLSEQPPHRVKTWAQLEEHVQALDPSLIVLLPHSLVDDELKLPALEIGGDTLPVSQLTHRHIRREGVLIGPIVLLLGCTTQLADVPFQNFAETFKQEQASVVLSTLSMIRGRHAAALTADLLNELKRASREGDVTFGDVLLRVKRTRLAKGDPLVLSLAAYGNAAWRC
jgi:hypothetical protein